MKKLTIEYIREKFNERGYTLLTEEYINNSQKLEYICPNGHTHSISWRNFSSGDGCPYCSKKAKPTLEFIKQEFEKIGWTLLSKEYINNSKKLDYICDKGHKHSISWGNFRKGKRCPYCKGVKKLTIEYIREKFNEKGWTLLSEEYINSGEKLEYICNKGHKHCMSWDNFKKGKNCPECSGYNISYTIEDIRKEFEKINWTLLSEEYVDSKTKLSYICDKGHKHLISWNKFQQGERCPFCQNYVGETRIKTLLELNNIEFCLQKTFKECKYKDQLRFDFYIPKHNICIEYDGIQHFEPIDFAGKGEEWAKEQFKEQQIKDNIKTQYCLDNNIKLIRIPYWEFDNIENILKQELNLE